MKTNFFKIVLPAFALMLAITASLAFTPAENDMEEEEFGALITVAYRQLVNPPTIPSHCSIKTNVSCQFENYENAPICTVQTGPQTGQQLFGQVTPGICNVILYKYNPTLP